MAQNSVDGIDRTIEQTNTWLKELGEELHVEDRQRAYLVLRAVLHALRDQLPVDEAAQFSAQLPMLVRGLYFEGWDPSKTPQRLRDRGAFLERVREEAVFAAEMDPERAVACTARVLSRHLSPGQLRDLCNSLPAEIRPMLTAA